MVLSDALVEEIFQTLIRLPYGTVEQLVAKLRAEVAIAQTALGNAGPIDSAMRDVMRKTIEHEG